MSVVTNKIINLFNEIDYLEDMAQTAREDIKKLFGSFDISEIVNMPYNKLKDFYKKSRYYMSIDLQKEFERIINQKKIELYPELLRATYYPKINSLDVIDEEKLRLDKLAMKNHRRRIPDYIKTDISESDIKRLIELGIVTVFYSFSCPECSSEIVEFEESELKKYFRYWDLSKKEILTDDEKEEMLQLEDGYFCITLECYHCSFNEYEITEICDYEDFEEYKSKGCINQVYCFYQEPDTTYDKL